MLVLSTGNLSWYDNEVHVFVSQDSINDLIHLGWDWDLCNVNNILAYLSAEEIKIGR